VPNVASVATESEPAPENIAKTSIGALSGAKMPEDARLARASPAPNPVAELPSIDSLERNSDFTPFMRAEVEPALRNQAMKKLFTDPHYNVMDRLDIYIDDYGQPDPIPPAMLRMMNQSKALGLFEDEEREEAERDEAARRLATGAADAAELPAGTTTIADGAASESDVALQQPSVAPQDHGAGGAPATAAEIASFPFAPLSST
jgi:hypothetical protein